MAKPMLSKDQIRVWESRLIQAYKLRQEHEDTWRTIREYYKGCLLYTSDAADDLLCVDPGGRRIIKKQIPT